jgi:hypothetical protein
MPGTRLTLAQAARLWAIEGSEAARALERLESARPEADVTGSLSAALSVSVHLLCSNGSKPTVRCEALDAKTGGTA